MNLIANTLHPKNGGSMQSTIIRFSRTLCIASMLISLFVGCALVQNSFGESKPISKPKLVQYKKTMNNKNVIVKKKKKTKAKITAYTPFENGGSTLTASGTTVKKGIVAVSKDLYRKGWTFGKRVSINDKIYVIADILPSRKNGFDIFMHSYKNAKQYGIQNHTVVLLD